MAGCCRVGFFLDGIIDMKLNVFYEDNHIIAVYKPAGMLVQGDETGDTSLLEEVREYIREKYHKPGNVFVGLVHRLDRPVCGIVVFARTSKGASRLSEQIRNRTFQKTYHALVENVPENKKDTLVHYIRKNTKTNIVDIFDHEEKDALRAELSYEVVYTNNNFSLIKINLKTGRPHQIRAQMSRIGCPIVGDAKYGARAPYVSGTIALCATEVSFKLPTKDEVKIVSVELPVEWGVLLDVTD